MAGVHQDPERGTNVNNHSNNNVNAGLFHFETWERKWTPWLIPSPSVAHAVIFIMIMYHNNCPKYTGDACLAQFLGRFSLQPWEENPFFGPSPATLEKKGALKYGNHEQQRVLTSMWMHSGIIHLLLNLPILTFFGIRLEQQFGFATVWIICATSGFGGSLLSLLCTQPKVGVGASNVSSGLLGAMVSELLANRTLYTNVNMNTSLKFLVIFVLMNLCLSLCPLVENFGSIGGFLTGSLMGIFLLTRPQLGRPPTRPTRIVIIAPINSIQAESTRIIGMEMLYREVVNGNHHCSW